VVLAEEGHRLLGAERPGPAARVLREALGLWRGPALADVVDEPFAQPERHRLEELRLVALEDRLAAELALGGHAAATAELQQIVGLHPFRERLHGLLMLALYRAGRQAEALQAFQEARRVLGEELGIDPTRWLIRMERDILRQAPGLDWTAPPDEAGQPLPAEAAGPAVEVAAPPVAVAVTAPSPPAGDGELVGRDEQLALLDRTLAGVAAGRGRLVLVAGEPGIGKTRLAEEVTRRAAVRGVRVGWGRCYQGEGAPAFWPWVQVARQLLAEVEPAQLGIVLGSSAGELSQLLPELKEMVPGLEPPPVVELAAARFRLYQAVTELVRQVAAARPLLVVVDDLHWADTGSLGLLAFLAAELRDAPLVVLGTYRDVDMAAGQPLAETLGALAREPVVERIPLEGLGEAEVARLATIIIGSQPGERLVRAVHDRTEGNPFFVTELLRLLRSEGDLHADDALAAARQEIPVGVRDVLQRRLVRLPEQTNAVLLVAAAAGREFDLDLVEAMTRLDEERALEAVEAAVVAGLLVEDDETAGRYRFAHGLVQETLYEQVSRARRVRLHARVAETLLGLHGPEDPEHALELARHAWAAVPVMGAEAALPYVLAAADHAMGRLAYEQAEQQLRRALQLLGSMPPSAERTRRELGVQVRLGHLLGELSSPGSPEAAAAFARAVELAAEATDDPAAVPALVGVHAGYAMRAEFVRARALAARVLDGARRSQDPQALLAGHFLLGHTLAAQGELVAARDHLQEALRLTAAMPEAARLPGIPMALGAAGILETVLLLGLPEQATEVAEAASRDIQRAPHPYPKAAAMVTGVYALRLLDDALAQIDRSGERYFEAEFHRLKGESLLTVSPPQAAEAAFATSIAVARQQGAKLLEDRATASLGRSQATRRAQSAR
jgi:tetratricopeptide (TPR) repeat protein